MHTGAVCRGVHRIGGSYAVDYQQGGEACRLYARCVVGADGGGSLVRRSLYGTHEIARYVAVQEWYADDSGSPFYGALFDEELTDCYGWLISKNDRLVLGAAFPQDNAARRFACLKRRLQKRGFVFGERVRREGCIVCRPTGPKSFCTGRDGAFLVGEAAGFISPSSLEGISYALDSGALLAKALLPGIAGAGRRYAQLTAGLRLRLLGKLMKNPFLYQPVIRETILESGLASLLVLSAAGGRLPDLKPLHLIPVQRPGAQRKDDKIAQDADHRAIDIPRLGERVVPDKRSGESGQQGTAECTAVGFHAEQRCRQRHQNQRRPEGIGEHQNRKISGTTKASSIAPTPVARLTPRSSHSCARSDIPGAAALVRRRQG